MELMASVEKTKGGKCVDCGRGSLSSCRWALTIYSRGQAAGLLVTVCFGFRDLI